MTVPAIELEEFSNINRSVSTDDQRPISPIELAMVGEQSNPIELVPLGKQLLALQRHLLAHYILTLEINSGNKSATTAFERAIFFEGRIQQLKSILEGLRKSGRELSLQVGSMAVAGSGRKEKIFLKPGKEIRVTGLTEPKIPVRATDTPEEYGYIDGIRYLQTGNGLEVSTGQIGPALAGKGSLTITPIS